MKIVFYFALIAFGFLLGLTVEYKVNCGMGILGSMAMQEQKK